VLLPSDEGMEAQRTGNEVPRTLPAAASQEAPDPAPSCRGVPIWPRTNVQAAIDAHRPGTTFCIKTGVHRLRRALIPKSNDRFIGAPGAVLNGSRRLKTFTRVGNSWVASRQRQQNPIVGGRCAPSVYRGCRYADHVFFDNRPLRRVMKRASVGPGTFYFDYSADKIYLGSRPFGHKVEAAVAPSAFQGIGVGAYDVTVRGLIVEKFAVDFRGAAIEGGRGWLVEGNEVRLNHGTGITAQTIRRNFVHDNGLLGVGANAPHVRILNNEIANNHKWGGFCDCWETGGAKFVRTTRLIVRGNYVHNNRGPGLWSDYDNIYTTFENNLIEDNTGPGIFYEASFDAVIRNNIIRRNGFGRIGWHQGAGVFVSASANVEVHDNVVDSNRDGIGAVQYSARGRNRRYGAREVRNLYVHDNTVVMRGGHTGLQTRFGVYYTARNNRFEDNTYRLGCVEKPFVWRDPSGERDYVEMSKGVWVRVGNDTSSRFVSICARD
jgi:parallel beta-helix repeat protein